MIHPKMKYVYVGIDSHKDTHCAVILNCFFEKLGEITFPNVPSEFESFLKEVQKLKLKGTKPAFGLEDVSAYGRSLAVFLTGQKQVVKHVNAALVASERRSQNVLHKTDSFDAECAARVLLNRFDGLPGANPQDKYWVLTNLVTRRRSIIKMNSALKNHLHAFITSHYPSYHKFFANIDCNSSLTFFERYPSPSKLEGVSAEELAEILEHANRSLRLPKAQQILDCVQNDGDTSSEFQEARDLAVQSIIRQINNNLQEIDSIDALLEGFLDNFEYKLTTMRGIDTVTAANLIAEIGDIRRFPTPAKLARYSGIAPVTYASGKTDVQFSNERGNRVLNSIFFRLAVAVTMTAGKNKRIINPFFYEYYTRKIAEGKTKRQALKCVQRRLVNIIWNMMTYNTAYINPPTQEYPKEGSENVS
ncbi:MAG: IS110 family transposase [Candidatus Saccharibacteria bacterium]